MSSFSISFAFAILLMNISTVFGILYPVYVESPFTLYGAGNDHVQSKHGYVRIVMQGDGQLNLHSRPDNTTPDTGWVSIWASGTNGNFQAYLEFENDGDLQMYTLGGSPIWNSGSTSGTPPFRLMASDIEVAYILDALNNIVWTTDPTPPAPYPTFGLTTMTPTPSPSLPTPSPSNIPSNSPSNIPSSSPSDNPSNIPSVSPTNNPSVSPTTSIPSNSPTDNPSNMPSFMPSNNPSDIPTNNPSIMPTASPSNIPSNIPTNVPTKSPTNIPTNTHTTSNPTKSPTYMPTFNPLPPGTPTKSPVTSLPTTSSPTTLNPTTSIPTFNPLPLGTPTKSPVTTSPTITPNGGQQEVTDPPTSAPNVSNIDNNISDGKLTIDNWIYIAVGFAVTLCCLTALCVLCIRRKNKKLSEWETNRVLTGDKEQIKSMSNVSSLQSTSSVHNTYKSNNNGETHKKYGNNTKGKGFKQNLENNLVAQDILMDDIVADMNTPGSDDDFDQNINPLIEMNKLGEGNNVAVDYDDNNVADDILNDTMLTSNGEINLNDVDNIILDQDEDDHNDVVQEMDTLR